MKLSDFYYELPESRIAQEPITPRDHSRLCVVEGDQPPVHRRFCDLGDYLQPGDLLVTNQTKVFPARLRGHKKTGGKIEVLLLAPVGPQQWRCLVRGATAPTDLEFPDQVQARMSDRNTQGEWTLSFNTPTILEYLERHGEMPLPPYIRRSERRSTDTDRYQTVFARDSGAVAAPTAGFHFTVDLLQQLAARGISSVSVTLHVGWGTFRPVRTDQIEDHVMLPEHYVVSAAAAQAMNAVRAAGKRIVAVGTTCVRTLETIADDKGHFHPGEGDSALFIYPGYRFKGVDALITNFHLPDSTPLLLANAFHHWVGGSAGRRIGGSTPNHPSAEPPNHPFSLRNVYEEAIAEGYRFYSYGDAMLIR